MNPGSERRGNTFHWEVLRRFPVVLPGFILLSLFAHVAAFFVFRVVYPPQATMSAPAPAITVLDPQRPDHQTLLRWIEAEDPAPVATVASGITDRLLHVTYQPSYATLRTPPLTLPVDHTAVPFPPARDPLTVIRSVEPKAAEVKKSTRGEPTRVSISGNLTQRVPGNLPPFALRTQSAELLGPATFLIGVDQRGFIQYIMPQVSSGNPAMDDAAADYLRNLKLLPAEDSIAWGHARVEWGAEAYPKSKSSP
jgi:hypothetical protein